MINEWGPICLALNRTVHFGEGRMDCMIKSPLLITLLLQPGLTLHPPLALPAANPGRPQERLRPPERPRLEPERLPLESRTHQERPSTNEVQRLVSSELHLICDLFTKVFLWNTADTEGASQRQPKRLLFERWLHHGWEVSTNQGQGVSFIDWDIKHRIKYMQEMCLHFSRHSHFRCKTTDKSDSKGVTKTNPGAGEEGFLTFALLRDPSPTSQGGRLLLIRDTFFFVSNRF